MPLSILRPPSGWPTPLLVVAIALASCSGGDGGTSPDPPAPRAILSLAASSQNFAGEIGAELPPTIVAVGNSGNAPLVWTATTNASWLVATPTSGTVAAGQSAGITVSVNVAGLGPGVQSGTLSVQAPGATGSPQQLSMTLTLTDPPPAVVGFSPSADATDVRIEAPVTVTFSRSVDLASLGGAIEVRDAEGTLVEGILSFDPATRTATFVPTTPLRELTTVHSVEVSGVRTPAGTPMAQTTAWSFTTIFLDPVYTYRLHNEFQGPDFVLDNFAVSSPADPRSCYMADASQQTGGTYWSFEPIPGLAPPAYLMRSEFGGPDLALEAADGVDPCLLTGLAPPGSYFTGQAWSFPPVGPPFPGAFRMQTRSFGSDRSLDVTNSGNFPELAYMAPTANFTGQVWYFTRAFRRPPR